MGLWQKTHKTFWTRYHLLYCGQQFSIDSTTPSFWPNYDRWLNLYLDGRFNNSATYQTRPNKMCKFPHKDSQILVYVGQQQHTTCTLKKEKIWRRLSCQLHSNCLDLDQDILSALHQTPDNMNWLLVNHLYAWAADHQSSAQSQPDTSLSGQEVTLTSFLRGNLHQAGAPEGQWQKGKPSHMTSLLSRIFGLGRT